MVNFIVFLGAGASVPFGIPTMTKLATDFEARMKEKYPAYFQLFTIIKSKLESCKPFDVEAIITVLQDIIDIDMMPEKVFGQPSVHYFSIWGNDFKKMIDYAKQDAIRNHENAKQMLRDLKGFIGQACVVSKQPFEIYDEFFHQCFYKEGKDFRNILMQIKPRKEPQPIEQCLIFTTNYDRVVEAYCRSRKIEYECGESSNQQLDIKTSNDHLYSNMSLFQIFKLHGSVSWYENQNHQLCWLSSAAEAGVITNLGDSVDKELAIYPAHQKYTFREPYYSMFHHLKEYLVNSKRCYVIGYSFRDDDILGLFHDGLEINPELGIKLIDPEANQIIKNRFSHFENRIQPIEMELSIDSAKNLASLS